MAVARYDSFVAQFLGDGILAYFGFPRAHETTRRAIHAGLKSPKLLRACKPARAKTLGAGRHRDRVVVAGDILGKAPRGSRLSSATRPSRQAAAGLAEPGSVVVSAAAQEAARRPVRLKFGPARSRASPEPVKAFRRSACPRASRFDGACLG